jgi:hypothetical protein
VKDLKVASKGSIQPLVNGDEFVEGDGRYVQPDFAEAVTVLPVEIMPPMHILYC